MLESQTTSSTLALDAHLLGAAQSLDTVAADSSHADRPARRDAPAGLLPDAPGFTEIARVEVDAVGAVVAAIVSPGADARAFRALKRGVRLVDVLERIDRGTAAQVGEAIVGGSPATGVSTVKVRGSWRSLRFVSESPKGSWPRVVTFALAHTPVDAALAEESRRRQAVSAALARITSLLNSDMLAEDMARAVLPETVSTACFDTGAILRVRSNGRAEVLAAYGPTRRRGFPYPALELNDPTLTTATHEPGLVSLAASSLAGLPAALRDVSPRGLRHLLLAPAFAGHTLRGILVLGARAEPSGQILEADFLRVVADGVGLSLGHSVLSRQSQLSEVVLDTSVAVARAISGSLDLQRTFQQIASSAARVMGNCSCLLLELRVEADDLVVVASSHGEDELLLGLAVKFEGKQSSVEALQEGRSIVVEDIAWGVGVEPVTRERLRFRSALFVPIRADGVLIGSLLLYSTERRDSYSPQDVARAEMVAEQAASAICNARLYRTLELSQQRSQVLLRSLTQLRQQKRKEWANVLHDDIVQTMVAALYEVQGLQADLSETAGADAERVATILRRAIDDTRRVIRDLRPPALDGVGLSGALQALVERADRESSSTVTLELAAVPELTPGVETALYLVAREALHNASRYSNAGHVWIRLAYRASSSGAGAVSLQVHDDGRGFVADGVDREGHFGLTMMGEQAALAGGELSLDSNAGGGTRVEVVVPLACERPDEAGQRPGAKAEQS
jgi:signal transduction histidine kinase